MALYLDFNDTTGLTLNLNGQQDLSIESTMALVRVVEVKMDTTLNWNNKITYIPKRGELIVYSDFAQNSQGENIPAMKIGDGSAYLIDLPFLSGGIPPEIFEQLIDHIQNNTIHVTEEEKTFWNAKLNYDLDDETLILNRL